MSSYYQFLGLLLTIMGAIIMYKNSPMNFFIMDGNGDDNDNDKEQVDKRNTNLKNGVGILVIGSIIQLLSNFVPLFTC